MRLSIWGLAVLSLFLPMIVAPPCFAGLHYTAEIRGAADTIFEAWAAGGRARYTVGTTSISDALLGMELLSLDGEKTLFFLNGVKKTYLKTSFEELIERGKLVIAKSEVGQRAQHVKRSQINKTVDEDGPIMLGYPTHHYRFHSTFTFPPDMPGGLANVKVNDYEDYWTAPGIREPPPCAPIYILAGPLDGQLLGSYTEESVGKLLGFPLKRTILLTFADSDGDSYAKRLSYQVREITITEPADSVFQVPPSYVPVPFPSASTQEENPN
jgi:hypothetical protein